jgi:hypothetical protein
MIKFTTIILKFAQNGDKTGWTYIEIPENFANQIKPGQRKTFRVKGLLDTYAIQGIALLPDGNGNFILPINGQMRKALKKSKGASISVELEEDQEYIIVVPADLVDCLEEEPEALRFFHNLSKSNRSYFIKWIESAKTIETRNKRIIQTVVGLSEQLDYGQTIRFFKSKENRST